MDNERFNAEAIKPNSISTSTKAEITRKETKVTIIGGRDYEGYSLWVTTPKTANRIENGLNLKDAVAYANRLLEGIF